VAGAWKGKWNSGMGVLPLGEAKKKGDKGKEKSANTHLEGRGD